jgi:4'-phosphopantetheinyl transferase
MQHSQVHYLWTPALTQPILRDDEVHVWSVALSLNEPTLQELRSVLSSDELLRSQRSPLVQEQNRFIAGRGSLRHILAWYLDTDPQVIQFGYGHAGKPFLPNPSCDIRFNISHSGDLALIAITLGREIGIDVEFMSEMPEMTEIASRFFSDQAKTEFLTAATGERVEVFYKCWTEKESISKCTGEGITEEKPLPANDITVFPLLPATGYAASLAIRGPATNVRTWHWSHQFQPVDSEHPYPVAAGAFLYCR